MKIISKLPLILFFLMLGIGIYINIEHLKVNAWTLPRPIVSDEEVFMSEEEKRKLEEAKELERIIKANEEGLRQIEKNDSIRKYMEQNNIDPYEGIERFELPEKQ
jgi:DNA-directed RNA polymerase subunit H (RpoH/RPB5)